MLYDFDYIIKALCIDQEVNDEVAADLRGAIYNHLKNDPQDSINNMILRMLSTGKKVELISQLTGVPIAEINRLKNTENTRH